jgi:pSer/pThr/pTyr-binding forkhead associated (FHA) protein
MMITGARAGAHMVLSPDRPTRIGRGLDCDIVLSDPLASRVHAIIEFNDGLWWIRDLTSRNGTYLNGQKIDEARLATDCRVKIGSTEFIYCEQIDPLSSSARQEHTQTVVRDRIVTEGVPNDLGFSLLQDNERNQDFLTLHQLSVRLLGCKSRSTCCCIARKLPSSAFYGSATMGN